MYLANLVLAVESLHSMDIIHRDLKPVLPPPLRTTSSSTPRATSSSPTLTSANSSRKNNSKSPTPSTAPPTTSPPRYSRDSLSLRPWTGSPLGSLPTRWSWGLPPSRTRPSRPCSTISSGAASTGPRWVPSPTKSAASARISSRDCSTPTPRLDWGPRASTR